MPRGWRRAGFALIALIALIACIAAQAQDDAAAAARLPRRVALLARAQAELEHGDAAQALDDFERAALMLHAADAERGLIRSAMQDGQYRRALALCAHVAGEHVDDADGGALYAWLLRVGGQPELAARTLADTRAHAPADAIVAAVERAFATTPTIATGLLREPPQRMAPWPVMLEAQAPPPADARFASSAVLLDDGASALVPLSALVNFANARAWVRNGLGQTAAATLEPDAALAARGVARLRLRSRLSTGDSQASSGRAPFAGSPGYAIESGNDAAPAWPTLTQGFLGGLASASERRLLGFDAGGGAAVLDVKGVLVGITLPASGGQSTWLPLAWLIPGQVQAAAPAPARAGLALVAPDEVYEAGLRRALQVLVAAH